MKAITGSGLLVILMSLVSCSIFEAEQTTYLRKVRNHAGQEEIQRHLGPPTLTATSQAGEPVWVYQVRDQQPGNRMTPPGMWCDEYVLVFDRSAVLRNWTHRSYFHGGELMPTYCVPGGYEAKKG
jgi:hypothetical protein